MQLSLQHAAVCKHKVQHSLRLSVMHLKSCTAQQILQPSVYSEPTQKVSTECCKSCSSVCSMQLSLYTKLAECEANFAAQFAACNYLCTQSLQLHTKLAESAANLVAQCATISAYKACRICNKSCSSVCSVQLSLHTKLAAAHKACSVCSKSCSSVSSVQLSLHTKLAAAHKACQVCRKSCSSVCRVNPHTEDCFIKQGLSPCIAKYPPPPHTHTHTCCVPSDTVSHSVTVSI